MSKFAWFLAFALSLALHATLAVSFRFSSGGEMRRAESQQVSIAGNLSDILGASPSVAAAVAEPLTAVRATPIEADQNHLSKPVSEVKPKAVRAVEPLKARAVAQAALVPVPAENLKAPDDVTLVKPVKTAPVKTKRVNKAPAVRSSKPRAQSVRQKRRASASRHALRAFARKIARALSRSRPQRIARNGTVLIAFTLSVKGGVEALRVKKSSGNAGIDRAAMRAVRRARFPKPPKGATRRQRSFVVPYHFRKR